MLDNARPLKGLVKGLVKKIKDGAKNKKWLLAWEAAASQELKEHTRPAGFKKGVLTIVVGDTTRAYELTLHKKELIDIINATLKQTKVKDIRFKIGTITHREDYK